MKEVRLWIGRSVSFCVAWILGYLCLAIFDELFSIHWLMPAAVAWLYVTVLARAVLSPDELASDLPIGLDVGAALRFLVNCATWPIRALMNRH